MRTSTIRVPLLWLLISVAGMHLSACSSPGDDRPNIVVILVDDMGYSDIGAYGGEIQTPHLDRLAQNGVQFTHFYNAARCCPTRAALLSGLYPHQTGIGRMVSGVNSDPTPGPYQGYLNDRSTTIAEVLGDSGYRTYMSGKWHVGEKPEHWPRRRGFERYFGLISGASSYFEIIKDQPRVRQMALDDQPWDPPAEGFYMTDAITEHAVSFLEQHHISDREAPFFLYVAYTAPHWPLHALPEDIARYEGRYDEGWDVVREERYERMKALGVIDDRFVLSPRTQPIPEWGDTENREDWIRRMEVYAAMVDRMDQGVGRIIRTLDETDEGNNTVIFFLSDNGGCAENIEGRNLNDPSVPVGAQGSYVAYDEPWANVSNTPFRLYKQWAHEGGIRTPMIAYWPAGIKDPGRMTGQVGHVIDIMATSLDLAGVSYPDSVNGHSIVPLEGKSLVPVLKGETREGHEALFWEHIDNKAMLQGSWKLVYDARRSREWEFFNIEDDPTEVHDLSAQYPERFEAMKAEWQAWAERAGVYPHP